MKPSITVTFLELGDATSRNLEFSHRTDVSVSYGEETITETNLLEIRRRHSDRIFVHTFPNTQEAKTGADWEWHIIGRSRTARMRVQAKRLQCNHVLKVKHKVVSSGKQQRQLLIDGANADGMKPLYCIYCSEPQRTLWTQGAASGSYQAFQSGCLLADASDIPLTTKKLDEIEDNCIPWHYLFKRSMFLHRRDEFIDAEVGSFPSSVSLHAAIAPIMPDGKEPGSTGDTGWNAPTIDDLNGETGRDFDRAGVRETTDEDQARVRPLTAAGRQMMQDDRGRLRERGIHRMLVIDVRREPDSRG